MANHREQTNLIENELRLRAHHIRDELLTGELDAESANNISQLLSNLQAVTLPRDVLKSSRIHLALLDILDKGGDWPADIFDQTQQLVTRWEAQHGRLRHLNIELYGPGGTLNGIATAEDTTWHGMEKKWAEQRRKPVSPEVAHVHGSMGFSPGKWWIHTAFAYYDGIISSADPRGGLSFDSEGCYALVLTELDSVIEHNKYSFTYKRRNDASNDGWPRLVASFLPDKTPIRVLRSSTLKSVYSPVSGVRYDGLYKITHWTHRLASNAYVQTITLTRETDPYQQPLRRVMQHPLSFERDDYTEFMRLRGLAARSPTRSPSNAPFSVLGSDSDRRGVTVSWADEEEVAELQAFEFPVVTGAGAMKSAKRMPEWWSAERL